MNKIFKFFLFYLVIIFVSIANAATLDEKIGQMVIVGFDNKYYHQIKSQIKKGDISGVILFSKNIENKEQMVKMNKELLSLNKIIPFLSIDNEGGLIQRYDFKKHPSAMDIANSSEKYARKEDKEMAQFEKELLINYNFAPVVDLSINPNSVIVKKKRSYGNNPDEVIKYAKIFIEEHNKENILISLKHFPGHGSVVGDTHNGFVDATLTFQKKELKPYIELKDYNNATVMVSHIYNSGFDDKYPASLSKKTIDYLKNDIGFKGLIVSDDYDMGAIRKNYSLDEILKNAINSGIDIMIFSNNINTYDKNIVKKIHKSIKKQVRNKEIDIENINKAYDRIVQRKQQL